MSVEKKQELGELTLDSLPALNYPHIGVTGIFDAEGNMSEMVKGILKQLNQGATAYVAL